jgi:peroxiredoxin
VTRPRPSAAEGGVACRLAHASVKLLAHLYGDRGPSILAPLAMLSISEWLTLSATLSILLIGGARVLLLIQILRQQGRILLWLEVALQGIGTPTTSPGAVPGVPPASVSGLPVGATAPRFRAQNLDGESVELDDLLAPRKPVLLLFIHPQCGPCDALMPDVAAWQRVHGEVLTIPVISEGTVKENRKKSVQHGLNAAMALAGFRSTLIIDRDARVTRAFGVTGTPMAVLLDERRRVTSEIAIGADAFFRLAKHGTGNGS